jgi:hypothetical protein
VRITRNGRQNRDGSACPATPPSGRLRGGTPGRPADDEFRLEKQFLWVNGQVLDLVHQPRDSRLALDSIGCLTVVSGGSV